MRVALLSLYDFDEVKGGIELFVRHLRRAFPDSKNFSYSTAENWLSVPDLTRVNLERERKGLAVSRAFAKQHKRNPFDLVICNDFAGVGLKLFAPEVPAIQVYHFTYRGFSEGALQGIRGYGPSRYLHPSFEKLSANGKHIVAVSHKTRRELNRYYGLSAQVIENAVPLDIFKPLPRRGCRDRLGIEWEGPIGIFVGRTDSTKGFDVVKALARRRKDIRILCVTGSDYVDEDMIIARRVPNEEMPVYYSAADFLLFPSRYESASYTTIEAMACDLPVIAYRTGLFEDIEERQVGRILKDVDEVAFSKAIDDVLANGKIHTRDLAEKRYSMDRFVKEYRCLAQTMVERAD